MALRNILQEGDPALTKVSRRVEKFDDRLHTLLDDMRDTLLDANGVGLAAPQVGVLRRVVLVIDINRVCQETDDPEAAFDEQVIELINPEIVETEGEQEGPEGCLSVPGLVGIVSRPMRVRVRAQDRFGKAYEVEGEGLTARCFCHEIDHLDGKLYTSLCDELFDADNLPEQYRQADGEETESE